MNAEIRIRDKQILRLKAELKELHDRYAELLDKGITGAEETRVELKELRKVVEDHVVSMDHIMEGPASFSREQKIAQLIGDLQGMIGGKDGD